MKGITISEKIHKKLAKDMQHFLLTAAMYTKNYKEPEIRPTHLVYSILVDVYPNICVSTLETMKVDVTLLIDAIDNERKRGEGNPPEIKISNELLSILERGVKSLKKNEQYDSSDFFMDLLRYQNELSDVFLQHAINHKVFKETMAEMLEDVEQEIKEAVLVEETTDKTELEMHGGRSNPLINQKTKSNIETLLLFGEILNLKYKNGKISPCIGRDEEIQKIERILNRKNKRNVLLIGGAGVGKTNIVEGLIERIESKNVSTPLLNAKIYALDINAIISGSIYRGQAEEKLKTIIDICVSDKYIIFIDEAHLMTNYGNGGNIDIVNVLKPLMARGDIQIIGATTNAEYKQYMEKDRALVRRFSIEYIKELDKESTLNVLKQIRKIYEETHNVKYSDEILQEIVEYTDKFIKNKKNPDKSIELMDDIGAKCNTIKKVEDENILFLKKQLADIKNKKIEIRDNGLYHLAEGILQEEKRLHKLLAKEFEKNDDKKSDVLLSLSEFRDILQSKKGVDYMKFLSEKEVLLKNIVKGQDETIEYIISDIKTKYFFLDLEENRPITYYFLGDTGVGKTFLADNIAKEIYDNKIFRIEGEDYKEQHSVANLVGSPKGYVGSESGSALYEYVKENPECVIVFNEIEKAHPSLYDFFLTIMDEGIKTDKDGIVTNFQNCLIIFTSNVGTQKMNIAPIGFGNININKEDFLEKELKNHFKPEFINRLTNIFYFKNITDDVYSKILEEEIEKIYEFAEKKDANIKLTVELKEKILSECRSKKYGVRELKRQIQKQIKKSIIEQYEKRPSN